MLAHARNYANTVTFEICIAMLKTGQPGHMFPREADLWPSQHNLHLSSRDLKQDYFVREGTHVNFDLFYGHKEAGL